METIKNTRIIDLTAEQFIELLKEAGLGGKSTPQEIPSEPIERYSYMDKKYVFGYRGIADFFNCSKACIYNYIKDGWIKPAISQMGRKIICDTEVAMRLFKEYKSERDKL
jgi:hypothetical protein